MNTPCIPCPPPPPYLSYDFLKLIARLIQNGMMMTTENALPMTRHPFLGEGISLSPLLREMAFSLEGMSNLS